MFRQCYACCWKFIFDCVEGCKEPLLQGVCEQVSMSFVPKWMTMFLALGMATALKISGNFSKVPQQILATGCGNLKGEMQ